MNATQLCKLKLCEVSDLQRNRGVAVLVNDLPGESVQLALFYLPELVDSDTDQIPQTIYAIQNYDPIGQANVLSRGIVGDIDGQLVVASPLYKQHFRLQDGQCIEEPQMSVAVYDVRIEGADVYWYPQPG